MILIGIMTESEINLKLSEEPTEIQIKKLKNYFKEIPLSEILSGLKFANNRWIAKDAGVLKVGRKSILQKESSFCYCGTSSMEIKKLENDDY